MEFRDGQTSFITSDVLFTSTSVPHIRVKRIWGELKRRRLDEYDLLFILRSYGKKSQIWIKFRTTYENGLGCIKRKSDRCCSGGYENIRYRSDGGNFFLNCVT